MNTENYNKYLSGFSTELYNFLEYVDTIIPTLSTQSIMKKYSKLNILKLLQRYNKIATPLKQNITDRDESIFSVQFFVVPEFNMSFFWEHIPVDKREHIWKTLSRLLIYSNVVTDILTKGVSGKVEEMKVNEAKKKKKRVNAFAGVGNVSQSDADFSIESLIKNREPQTNSGDKSMDMLMGVMKMMEKKFNLNGITDKLKDIKLDQNNSVENMSGEFDKVLKNNVKDPEAYKFIKNMMDSFKGELEKKDLSHGDLTKNLIDAAMATNKTIQTEMENGNVNFKPEQLLETAQSLMKGFGLGDNINLQEIMSKISPDTLSNMNGENFKPENMMSMVSGLLGGESLPEGADGSKIAMLDLFSSMVGM